MMCLIANSQDLNILDIELFSALHSLQYNKSLKSLDDLLHAVEKSF